MGVSRFYNWRITILRCSTAGTACSLLPGTLMQPNWYCLEDGKVSNTRTKISNSLPSNPYISVVGEETSSGWGGMHQ